MKAITKFLESLSENYYEKFLIEDPFYDEESCKRYFWEVEYKKKKYFELDIDEIALASKDILNKSQDKFKKALSESYRLISNKKASEINSIIENIKKSAEVHLNIIKNDFYMDDTKSRYYSVTVYSNQYFSMQEALIKLSKEMPLGRFYNSSVAFYGYFDLWYDNKRDATFAFLSASLFTIGKAFVVELEKIKREAISNEIEIAIPLEAKLKWDAKPAHLGYIIGMLADSEFLDAPKRDNGDINYTQFAKQVLNVFNVDTKESTLTKYLNTTTEKAQETKRKFDEIGFDIPHKKRVN